MLSSNVKYIGLDVHKEAVAIAVLNGAGKLVMESIVETKASTLFDFLHGLRGELHVTLEEGTWAGLAVRRAQASCRRYSGLQSAPQRVIERRQQERQDRCAKAGRAAAEWNAARGLPRRERTGDAARVGAWLSDHQQRPGTGDESAQGTVSKLGHSLLG